jgi:fatty acid desaturase
VVFLRPNVLFLVFTPGVSVFFFGSRYTLCVLFFLLKKHSGAAPAAATAAVAAAVAAAAAAAAAAAVGGVLVLRVYIFDSAGQWV